MAGKNKKARLRKRTITVHLSKYGKDRDEKNRLFWEHFRQQSANYYLNKKKR